MRTNAKRWALFFLALTLVTAASFVAAYHKGEKVEVEWHGTWYPATVLDVDGNRCFIHYDSYDDSWNEWVGPDRVRGTAAKVTGGGRTDPPKGVRPMSDFITDGDAGEGKEMTIRWGGSIWAVVEASGTVRINGSIAGRFEPDGTVRKSGSIVGEIEEKGTIRLNGSIVGEIESDGTLRRGGSIIGEIESSGTIRKGGSIWGSASHCCMGHTAKRRIAAVLVFFSGDFGY